MCSHIPHLFLASLLCISDVVGSESFADQDSVYFDYEYGSRADLCVADSNESILVCKVVSIDTGRRTTNLGNNAYVDEEYLKLRVTVDSIFRRGMLTRIPEYIELIRNTMPYSRATEADSNGSTRQHVSIGYGAYAYSTTSIEPSFRAIFRIHYVDKRYVVSRIDKATTNRLRTYSRCSNDR